MTAEPVEGSTTGVEAGPVSTAEVEAEPSAEATRLAIASAGASILGFVALFRLTSGWDDTRARALRRFLGVLAESLTGATLGFTALLRLRGSPGQRMALPLAVLGVLLGASNVVRVFNWMRLGRRAD